MISPKRSTRKRTPGSRRQSGQPSRTLLIALTGAVCPILMAALLLPAPQRPIVPLSTVGSVATVAMDTSAAHKQVSFDSRIALEIFAAPISMPAPLDDSGHAALSSEDQKKLDKLAKKFAKASAKLAMREEALELWQSRLLDAQQDLTDALFLPEDTKKEKKAKKKAVKKALQRMKRAQARINHYQALILKSEALIAAKTAEIIELDESWFSADDLDPPTGLSASAAASQVTFDWDMVEGATSYTLYWSLSQGIDPGTATAVSIVSSSAVVDGLDEDQTVYAAVTAHAGSTESVLSSEVSATTGVESGDIQIDISPNRTSGVAPLAVFFDATDTESSASSRPFHELSYAWNFGDDSAGSWSTTGNSRNMARGPIAAHVFESPGVYTVTMVARDIGGGVANQDVIITVQDPDAIYAGFNTVCVSRNGDFSGAPTGSLHVTTTSFSEAMSHVATGKRVLLRRGEAWSVSSTTGINQAGPGTIGAFGTGDKPSLDATATVFDLSGSTPAFDDWRIMDLDITTGGQHNAFRGAGQVRNALILRCDMTECSRGVELSGSIISYWNENGSPQPMHDAITVAECTVTNSSAHQLYIAATRLMVLGGDFDTSLDSHVLRLTYVGQGVISNNHIRGAASGLHELKLHAPNFTAEGIGQGVSSEEVVISDNRIESVETTWPVALAPQSSAYDERVRNVILERNHLVGGPSTQVLMYLSATQVTVRNNLFDQSGTSGSVGVRVGPRGIEPVPNKSVVANNTFYRSDSANLVAVEVTQECVDSSVFNNLAYAPFSGNASVFSNDGIGTTASNNMLFTSTVFVSPSPSEPADFHLASGSPAIDGGVLVPGVFYDYELNASPSDGDGNGEPVPDVGAFEYD